MDNVQRRISALILQRHISSALYIQSQSFLILGQEFNFGTKYLEKYTPHLFQFFEIGHLNYELQK